MNAARNVRTGEIYRHSAKRQAARLLFMEPERGSKVAHSTWMLHVGGPSAPNSQLVASIRRGGRVKAEDWGPVVYFWRITSTNADWYNRTVTTDSARKGHIRS